MTQRLGRPRAIARARASGAAIATRRGSKPRSFMPDALEQARRVGPEDGDPAEEPVDVVREPPGVEGPDPVAKVLGDAGQAADQDPGDAHDVDEVQGHGEALL